MATRNMIKPGLLIALALFSALSAASSRKISSTAMHISGNVVAKPCTFDKTVDTVQLPPLVISSWDTGFIPFTVSLSCPPGIETVNIVPSGTYDQDRYHFVNTGTAENLHFVLIHPDSTTMIAADGSERLPVDIANGVASMTLRIRANPSTSESAVTPGTMATSVSFRFDYD